jgi:hypothetical protein
MVPDVRPVSPGLDHSDRKVYAGSQEGDHAA